MTLLGKKSKALSLVLAALIAGCNSNQSGDGAGGTPAPVKHGQFIDSPVEGLGFTSASQNGLTDRQGRFSYRDGETVRYAIGKVVLGQAPGAPVVTPGGLSPASAERFHRVAVNLARLLLTLDADADAANGIQITAAARSAGDGANPLNFDQSPADFAEDADVQAFIAAARPGATLLAAAAATQHLQQTLDDLDAHQGRPNLLPQADAGADFQAIERSAVRLDGGRSADADGDSLVLAWQQLGGPAVALSGIDTATPGFTAPVVSGAPLELRFRLTVTDVRGGSGHDEVTVRVVDRPTANVLPVAAAGLERAVKEGTQVILDGSASVDEEDGDTLAYAWTQAGSGPTVELIGANTPTPSFIAPMVDETTVLRFRLVVTDRDGGQGEDSVLITVNDRLAPTADAGPPRFADEGALVRLDGSGSTDADGTIATYAWQQAAGTPVGSIAGADSALPSFIVPDVTGDETLRFRLTVTDDDGLSSFADVDVTVFDRRIVSIADAAVDEGVAGATTPAAFTVTLSQPAARSTTVRYDTLDGSAVAGRDYEAAGGTLTFLAGETEKTVTVNVTGDGFEENDETFRVILSEADGAAIGNGSATATIRNDDVKGLLRVGAAKRSVGPSAKHIQGVDEERGYADPQGNVGTQKQRFGLGGYGLSDPASLLNPTYAHIGNGFATGNYSKPEDDGVAHSTYIRAMVVQQPGGQTVAFVTLDAVGAGNIIQRKLKAAVTAKTGIPADNILFGQTHSHSAADLQGLWGGVPATWLDCDATRTGLDGCGPEDGWTQGLYQRAAEAVQQAQADLVPANLVAATGTIDRNRRRTLQVTPDQSTDKAMTVLQASADETGTAVGTILQYAAHPIILGDSNRDVHADFVLAALVGLETRFGGTALYYNGPIADTSPATGGNSGCAANGENGTDYCKARNYGRSLAGDAAGLLGASAVPLDPILAVRHANNVVLPVTNPLFLGAGLLRMFNRYYNFVETPVDSVPEVALVRNELPQVAPFATTTVSRVTLGSPAAARGLEIATIPGEGRNSLGQLIRLLARNAHGATTPVPTMLLGLTHNSFGYIVPEQEFGGAFHQGELYEEIVSLGPLTAPLLRVQAYYPLFDAPPAAYVPEYMGACQESLDSNACMLEILEYRFAGATGPLDDGLDALANGCRDSFGGTPLESLCAITDLLAGLFDPGLPGGGAGDPHWLQAMADAQLRGCDYLDPNYCLFPFPNDFFTVPDAATDTGRRVNFNIAAMPRNVLGKPIDPSEWNRNDGFSPGALIETRVPGLSLDDAAYVGDGLTVPHLTQMHRSLEPTSAIVIIDATPGSPNFGKQHLAWAELDANTTKHGLCDVPDPVAMGADLAGAGPIEDLARQLREQCEAYLAAADASTRNDPVNDPGPALLIHPGVNFEEGHRYIVALRRLRGADGALLQPSAGFRVFRDAVPSVIPQIEARRAHMEELFALLRASEASVARDELYLAWDFTVASTRNLTERVLHMRNEAFANYLPTVGGVPEFSITSVEDFALSGDDCTGSAQHATDPGRGDANTENCIARRVTGTVTVPSYMDKPRLDPPSNPLTDQSPLPIQYVGGRLHYNPASGQPGAGQAGMAALPGCAGAAQNGNTTGVPNCALPLLYGDGLPDRPGGQATESFTFTCNIPRSAFSGAAVPSEAGVVRPARASLYGHGLLGSQAEGRGQAQLKRFANEHNFMFCMTDWIGMSSYDVANVATVLADMSNFPTLADRAQQGFLNKMFLARLLKDPAGFAQHPAFKLGNATLFDHREVFYDGNSQGGIMGGALVALSPDIQRGALGVVGMNYSTLLSRSTDFAPYGAIYYTAYPESLDQQFVFSLIQMLWDRAENNGYAQHLGDGTTADPRVGLPNQPLPGVPVGAYDVAKGPFDPAIPRMAQKEVLLHPAFGDHQVTHWSAEVMARTVGANGADLYFRRPADHGTAGGSVVHTYADKAQAYAQRLPDEIDFFSLGEIDYADAQAIRGSALVMWDEGKTAVPPLDNTYPHADAYDPHEYPRRTVAARCQKARFLRADGRVIATGGMPNTLATPCPQVDGAGAPFAGDAEPLTVGAAGPEPAAPDYGGGLLGILAQFMAELNGAITALIGGDAGGASAAFASALSHLGDNLARLSDAGTPGEALGTDVEPDQMVVRALSAERAAEPVVLTGALLPGWSQPAAIGLAQNHLSGFENYTGATEPGYGPRNAHAGVFLYPPNWQPGDAPVNPGGGADVSKIAAFRYDGAGFVEIPVQVDERYPYFLANGNSTFSFYSGIDPELSYAWDVEGWGMTKGECDKQYDPNGIDVDRPGLYAPVVPGADPNQGVSRAIPDPVAGLDNDDEIVLMASDAGSLYAGIDFPPEWQAVQVVKLNDPLDPATQRYVYLVQKDGGSAFHAGNGYVDYRRDANADQWIDRSFFQDGSGSEADRYRRNDLGTSNTSYGSNLSGTVCKPDGTVAPSQDRFPRDGVTVTTANYRWQASGRWMVRDLRVRQPEIENPDPAYWDSRPDLIDRWKGRAFQQSPDSTISLVGFEDEQVNWEANSTLLGERCGPVRCIREVWGADSGTNVTKTESFYRDAITYRYRVRVHPIPPDGLYTSWDYNREAMVSRDPAVPGGRYYTLLRPQGVPIDGINDDVGQMDSFPGCRQFYDSPISGSLLPVLAQIGAAVSPITDAIPFVGTSVDPYELESCAAFFDAADPSFNLALAFDNWEQISGKGDSGSLVYTFEMKGATSLTNPLVVPYYRDDACLDDGTGDDPVQRPWPGESYAWNNGAVPRAYNELAGRDPSAPLVDCRQRQGAHAAHGMHFFVTHDTDNAFTGVASTEIDGQQWQFIVPTAAPQNIAEPYANLVRAPLQAVAVPLPGTGAGASGGADERGFLQVLGNFGADLGGAVAYLTAQQFESAFAAAFDAVQSFFAGIAGVLVNNPHASAVAIAGDVIDTPQDAPQDLAEGAGSVVGGYGADHSGSRVRAGVGVVDMTPDVGYGAGQYSSANTAIFGGIAGGDLDPYVTGKKQNTSYGVQSRLTARAIVVEGNNGKRIVLLKSDNYLAQDNLIRRVAQILEQNRSSIGYEQILYHVTHAHSTTYAATLAAGVFAFQDAYDARFFEDQARKLAEAILSAERNLQPARMGATTVRHKLFKGNIMGPAIGDDGTPVQYPNEYGDHGLVVMRFETDEPAPRPIAVWVNWGEHPEGLDGYDLHSADFVGFLERFVERDLGVPLVFSQGDVGSAEKSGNDQQRLRDDGTVCQGPGATPGGCPAGEGVWRDWNHRGYAQNERNVRYLADAVIKGWKVIGGELPPDAPFGGIPPNDYVPVVQVALSGDFPVDYRNAWVPGPLSHPYPAVSNCRSEPTVEGDPGVPVAGLPDCAREDDNIGITGAVWAGAQQAGLPVDERLLIWETMKREGLPLPEHYDAPAFGALEENARLKLQAFRLGEVLLASCACEAQVDLILNFESRADDIEHNIYNGFDWACVAEDQGLLARDPAYAAACDLQRAAHYNVSEFPVTMRGSLADAAKRARMRAQIHNDAAGWDAPEYVPYANSEPADPAAIKGNFTREELPAHLGYKLAVGIGHAGDYNGYTVSYREFMSHDHYRKALTAYGPHTADYMVTRMVRLAAAMKGGPELAPEPLDTAAQADEARQVVLSDAHGQLTKQAYDAFNAGLSPDVGPAQALTQPADIAYFQAASFRWRGGSTAIDNPFVVVERCVDGTGAACAGGTWQTFADPSGEVQTKVQWPQGLPGVVSTYAGQQEWIWSANFEAYEAFPTRLGSTPAGLYRFAVKGCINDDTPGPAFADVLLRLFGVGGDRPACRGGATPYALSSAPFEVFAQADLVQSVESDASGTLSIVVAERSIPATYASAFPYVQERYDNPTNPRFCKECSFRPWAVSAAGAAAVRVQVNGVTYQATGAGTQWTAAAGLADGDTAIVTATYADGRVSRPFVYTRGAVLPP